MRWKRKIGRLAREQLLTLRRNYENYGESYLSKTNQRISMKTSLLLTALAVAAYFYLHNTAPAAKVVAAPPSPKVAGAQAIIIAAAPSSYNRWKTGPNAQTDLKTGPNAQTDLRTGPNAQTDFEPFAPNQQATWNQTPGYTIVSGLRQKVR
jgi:hypothetical protein